MSSFKLIFYKDCISFYFLRCFCCSHPLSLSLYLSWSRHFSDHIASTPHPKPRQTVYVQNKFYYWDENNLFSRNQQFESAELSEMKKSEWEKELFLLVSQKNEISLCKSTALLVWRQKRHVNGYWRLLSLPNEWERVCKITSDLIFKLIYPHHHDNERLKVIFIYNLQFFDGDVWCRGCSPYGNFFIVVVCFIFFRVFNFHNRENI